MNLKKGFTLVEMMSVVAIVSLLAALAMPNLLRSRVNANEAAVQAALRSIHAALTAYNFAQTPPSYPQSLTTLANANPPYITQEIANSTSGGASTSGAGTVSTGFTPPARNFKGYYFRYSPSGTGTRIYNYTLYAIPADVTHTGTRYFSMNASGTLIEVDYFTATGTAGQGGDVSSDF